MIAEKYRLRSPTEKGTGPKSAKRCFGLPGNLLPSAAGAVRLSDPLCQNLQAEAAGENFQHRRQSVVPEDGSAFRFDAAFPVSAVGLAASAVGLAVPAVGMGVPVEGRVGPVGDMEPGTEPAEHPDPEPGCGGSCHLAVECNGYT